MFNRHNRDSREPNQDTVVLCFCGENCEFADVSYDWGSFGLNDYPCSLCMPCCSDYSDLTNHPVAFGYAFSQTLFSLLSPFWTEKSPRTLLRAWTAIIRKTALHATKQSRWKNTFFGSILWCKASKQQGDNDSQPANCFLNSIMRIWLESIVSRIYSFVR